VPEILKAITFIVQSVFTNERDVLCFPETFVYLTSSHSATSWKTKIDIFRVMRSWCSVKDAVFCYVEL
jgi:hypothetical protein